MNLTGKNLIQQNGLPIITGEKSYLRTDILLNQIFRHIQKKKTLKSEIVSSKSTPNHRRYQVKSGQLLKALPPKNLTILRD